MGSRRVGPFSNLERLDKDLADHYLHAVEALLEAELISEEGWPADDPDGEDGRGSA